MADDKELEAEQGKVLPIREMMSLISTDPGDPMYSTLVPTEGPASGTGPAGAGSLPSGDRLPVEGPGTAVEGQEGALQGPEGSVTSEPRSETITQSDSASATS